MHARLRTALLVIVALAVMCVGADRAPRLAPAASESPAGGSPFPSDWFGMQRAYPETTIPQQKVRAALEQARLDRALSGSALGSASQQWTQAGPFNIGGRVTALAVTPDAGTVFLGSANGGVFKSTDEGTTWTPIFDDLGIYSIGAIALDPSDPDRVYVGTGEANSSVDSYDGAGVFRSGDGGRTWQYIGLEATARIARIAVDPENPDRIFVAAMGRQFSTGPDRGLYRSENGGASWTPVLFVNDSTGAADVVIHPAHPETVYCATWERIRRPSYRRAYGPGCGIWRSVDHGTTWTRLQNGLPPPSDAMGRIGLALAPSHPSTIYAQIITGASGGYQGLGLYRSTDGGNTWSRRDQGTLFTGSFDNFGWYFGDVAVDPLFPGRIYTLGVKLLRSEDGGANYIDIRGTAHVDQHAMWIWPTDPQRIYLGNDGGFYRSTNGGLSWFKAAGLPITQFYTGAIDPSNPTRLLGGTQDNNTLITPPPGSSAAGSPSAWSPILVGDGFYCVVDPVGPDTILAEWQFCCGGTGPRRSTNGGISWSSPSGFIGSDRYNWNTPIVMHPNDHRIVLVGSQRVYKSTNNGQSYIAVSGDLTSNPPALLTYGTVSTLDISPLNSSIYFAGTDDGRVWRSADAGGSWTEISAGLPRRWVTRVTADRFDANVVYVTLSGFGLDEHLPHVYRSANLGDTWVSISANLPDVPANDILVDPLDPQALYLATDVGVYATLNLGAAWFPLATGMPVQTVFDLTLHAPSRTLVAATHGRSQWKLDLNQLQVAVTDPNPAVRLTLTAPTPNPSWRQSNLSLELSSASRIEVTVYDVSGRRVRSLLEGRLEAGRHPIEWNGHDEHGRDAGAGVFFLRASGSGGLATQRLVRAR